MTATLNSATPGAAPCPRRGCRNRVAAEPGAVCCAACLPLIPGSIQRAMARAVGMATAGDETQRERAAALWINAAEAARVALQGIRRLRA